MNGHSSDQVNASGIVDLSIVLCTRNRAAQLSVTLEYLRALHVPEGYRCEIIVVDNGSTDDTPSVCAASSSTPGIPLRSIYAAAPGISRARNAAISASASTILAFTDDDVHPQADWLQVIARAFAADPALDVICGRVELQNPEDLPMSIRRLESRKEFQGMDDSFNTFIGCNFAVRRPVFDRIGLFDPAFGTGALFHAAEDAEFSYRAWKSGERIIYLPELFVLHDHGRRTSESELNLVRGYIYGRGAFYAKYALKGDSTALRQMYWELRPSLRTLTAGEKKLGWRHPLWLLKGFVQYVWFRLTHPRARSEQITLRRTTQPPVK
jgi:GT2 family glycosyltransferase